MSKVAAAIMTIMILIVIFLVRKEKIKKEQLDKLKREMALCGPLFEEEGLTFVPPIIKTTYPLKRSDFPDIPCDKCGHLMGTKKSWWSGPQGYYTYHYDMLSCKNPKCNSKEGRLLEIYDPSETPGYY